MTSISRILIGTMTLGALVLTAACDKSKSDEPAASASAIELTDDDVPVAEDFIEEATKAIDENNLSAKLDDLEKEIGAE
jgi:hypothetical protein